MTVNSKLKSIKLDKKEPKSKITKQYKLVLTSKYKNNKNQNNLTQFMEKN